MAEFRGTSGDWHLAAQNDVLHVIAGAAPSQGNDDPWHDRTDRVVLARLYDRADGEGHPSHEEAAANGLVMVAALDLLAACEAVAAMRTCSDAADWKDAFGRLTRLASEAARKAKGE